MPSTTKRRIRLLCHDCYAVLTADDRTHYVYQCHACVVVEHERLRIHGTDPDHPDAAGLASSAVELTRLATA